MPLDLTQIQNTIDVFCDGDFLPHMPEVRGRAALAQRLLRRLSTRRGSLPYLPDDGIDVRDYLLSARSPAVMIREISDECLKDEQVDQCFVQASLEDEAREVTIEISIIDAAGPFRLTLSASEAAVELVQLQQEGA